MVSTVGEFSCAEGDRLPVFERVADLPAWNRYAAVNDEFIPIHMDDAAGRAAGYSTAFGMGNLTWSYLHSAIRQWLGDRGRIVSVSTQFRAAVTRPNVVRVHGVVLDVVPDGTEIRAELEIWAEDADGTRLAPGRATVAFPGTEHSPT